MKWRNKGITATPTKREAFRYYCNHDGKWHVQENFPVSHDLKPDDSTIRWLFGGKPKEFDDDWVLCKVFGTSKEAHDYITERLRIKNYKPVYLYVRV